jgi:hypothetical protein
VIEASAETRSVLADTALSLGGERAIVYLFVTCHQVPSGLDDRMPFASTEDTIRTEMAFAYGRADVVMFHLDGSATVVEVKDGTKGYTHVIAGIGQAGLYATQLSLKGTVRKVRRALLWTSVGDAAADGMIEMACEEAGVIPLSWGKLSDHLQALR